MLLIYLLALIAVGSLAWTLFSYLTVPVALAPSRYLRAETPPISVLKPLCGVDDALWENLKSFAEQDYPSFELILGAEDPADPALEVARRLQDAYPRRRIVIVAGAPSFGRNPKITNLASLSRQAKHELLLISDSNVRAGPEYLRAIAAELSDPKVGLVTNLVVGAGERSLGARFENLHLNTFVSSAIAGAKVLLGHSCVLGKSMLFRRSDLERLGGWRALRHVLGEDYVVGQRFAEAGLRVALSPYLLETVNQDWSLSRFVNRHLRWAQIRRRIWLTAYLVELSVYPTPWLLALLFAAGSGTTVVPLAETGLMALAVAGLVLKLAADAWLIHHLRRTEISLLDLACVPLKDCLVLVLWVVGLLKQSVQWRGHALWIGAGSRLHRLPPPRRWRAAPAVEEAELGRAA